MAFNEGHSSITCCKKCTERFPGCHGTCEKYIQQRAEYDKQKAERNAKIAAARGLSEYKYDGIHKTVQRRVYRSKYRKGH